MTTSTAEEIHLQVGMDYPGKMISVNHCYAQAANGRRYLRREARHWRDKLATDLNLLLYNGGYRGKRLRQRVLVRIDAAYTDEHHAVDPNNLCKLVYDAIEQATGINDRHCQPVTGQVGYGVAVPYIIVTVTLWAEED